MRSLISIPAGVTRMPLPLFTALTLTGSLIWNTVLILAGYWLGEQWHVVIERLADAQREEEIHEYRDDERPRRPFLTVPVAPGDRPPVEVEEDGSRSRGEIDGAGGLRDGILQHPPELIPQLLAKWRDLMVVFFDENQARAVGLSPTRMKILFFVLIDGWVKLTHGLPSSLCGVRRPPRGSTSKSQIPYRSLRAGP